MNRLRELARIGALDAHVRAMHNSHEMSNIAADPGHVIYRPASDWGFATCPHPDCVLVRPPLLASPLHAGAESEESIDDLLVAVYQLAKDHWCAQCYGFTGAPEHVKRGAHEAALEGFDAICKRLGPVVHPLLRAEYKAAAALSSSRTAPIPCLTCSGRGWVMRYETHDIGAGLRSGGAWNEPCPVCHPPASRTAPEGPEKKT